MASRKSILFKTGFASVAIVAASLFLGSIYNVRSQSSSIRIQKGGILGRDDVQIILWRSGAGSLPTSFVMPQSIPSGDKYHLMLRAVSRHLDTLRSSRATVSFSCGSIDLAWSLDNMQIERGLPTVASYGYMPGVFVAGDEIRLLSGRVASVDLGSAAQDLAISDLEIVLRAVGGK